MLGILLQLPAVADSVGAALNAQDAISGLLAVSFPWLDANVVLYVSKLLASIPLVSMIFTWEFIGKKLREASPWVNEHVGKRLEKWAFLINPLLGFLIGSKMGDPLLGLAGGALWSMIRSGLSGFSGGKLDPANALKVKAAAALLACSLLLGASPAAAAEPPGLLSRFTLSAGLGLERDLVSGAPVLGIAAIQPGYTLSNNLALRVRVDRPFKENPEWRCEAFVWFVF